MAEAIIYFSIRFRNFLPFFYNDYNQMKIYSNFIL